MTEVGNGETHSFKDIAKTSNIEDYLVHVKTVRNCSPGTIVNYCQSLIRAVKYFYRDGQDGNCSECLGTLRRYSNQCQKEATYSRDSTCEGMKARNQWLDWNEIKEVVVEAYKDYQAAVGQERDKHCRMVLVLLMYTLIPPGRGKEYREMKLIVYDDGPISGSYREDVNCFHYSEIEQKALMTIVDHKTSKFHKKQTVEFPDNQLFISVVREYIYKYRKELIKNGKETDDFILNNNGESYTSSEWTKLFTNIFTHYTGQAISVNVIRSSFITHALDDGTKENILDSIAEAMRHSRRYQTQVYDKRTFNQRIRGGLDYAHREMTEMFQRSSPGIIRQADTIRMPGNMKRRRIMDDSPTIIPEPKNIDNDDNEDDQSSFIVRDEIVALVAADSTPAKPQILLGKVVKVDIVKRQVILNAMVETYPAHYTLKLGQSRWRESIESVITGIDIEYLADKKVYSLRTPISSIVEQSATSSTNDKDLH